jgi:DNA-binding transcriptional LysR family regulator
MITNLASVDLNLLLVLHAVLSEQSATGAARRLNVTQSAVSNSLARLRTLFSDPLFVRSGKGFSPTPKARELAPRLAHLVAGIENVMQGEPLENPLLTTRCFTLACPDWVQLRDVPRLFEAFRSQLPHASLSVVPLDDVHGHEGLVRGDVDVVLGPRETSAVLSFEPLYVERAALVVRKNHPRIGDSLTDAELEALPRVEARVQSCRLELKPSVVLSVSQFTTAALAAARSDCGAVIPASLATELQASLPLRTVKAPMLDKLEFEISLGWHERTDADPSCRFLRGLVLETLSTFPIEAAAESVSGIRSAG